MSRGPAVQAQAATQSGFKPEAPGVGTLRATDPSANSIPATEAFSAAQLPQHHTLADLQAHWPSIKATQSPIQAAGLLKELAFAAHREQPRQLPAELIAEAQKLVMSGLHTLSGPQTAEVSTALLKLGVRDRDTHQKLAAHLMTRMSDFQDEEKKLVSLVWEYGQANIRNFALFHQAARYVATHADSFQPKWYATLACAASEVRFTSPEFYALCALKLYRDPCLENARAAEKVRQAFSRIDVADPRFLSALGGEEVPSLEGAPAAVRPKLLSILSSLGLSRNPASDRMAEQVLPDLKNRTGADIAKLVRLHHELGTTHFEFYREAQRQLLQKKDELSFSDWSYVAEAYAHRPQFCAEFWNVCATETIRRGQKGSLKDFVRLISACRAAKFYDPELMEVAAARFQANDGIRPESRSGLHFLDQEQLASVASSFAALNHYDRSLFYELGKACRAQGVWHKGNHLADVAWACAVVHHDEPELTRWLFDNARTLSHSMSLSNAAQVAWAAAVLECPIGREVYDALHERLERRNYAAPDKALRQMYQAGLALGVPFSEQAEAAFEMAVEHQRRRPRLNPFEREVMAALLKTGVDFERQVPERGYFLDFLVHIGDRRVVLECDGDRHHRVNGRADGELLGNDRIRDRVLHNLGYEVVRVSDSEWERVTDPPAALREKLGLEREAAGAEVALAGT